MFLEKSDGQRGPCSEVRNDQLSDSEDEVASPLGGGEARSN